MSFLGDECPKNLTFSKAERDQRCQRLVVVVFCLFFFNLLIRFIISQSDPIKFLD